MTSNYGPMSPVEIRRAVIAGWAMTCTLPMRRHCGKHYIGREALFGIAIIFGYAAFAPAPHLIWLEALFCLSIALNWSTDAAMRKNGVIHHTFFDGDPWLARLIFRSKDDRRCKAYGEPLLAVFVSYCLYQRVPVYAGFFFVAACAMVIVQFGIERELQRRLDEMHNGRIENEALTHKYRTEYQPQRRTVER
jgi:hypothetical protein